MHVSHQNLKSRCLMISLHSAASCVWFRRSMIMGPHYTAQVVIRSLAQLSFYNGKLKHPLGRDILTLVLIGTLDIPMSSQSIEAQIQWVMNLRGYAASKTMLSAGLGESHIICWETVSDTSMSLKYLHQIKDRKLKLPKLHTQRLPISKVNDTSNSNRLVLTFMFCCDIPRLPVYLHNLPDQVAQSKSLEKAK